MSPVHAAQAIGTEPYLIASCGVSGEGTRLTFDPAQVSCLRCAAKCAKEKRK